MHRDMGQPSLAESLLPETLGHASAWNGIAEAFDWDRFGRLLARVHSAQEGRPSYPPLMMVKVLLLEQWYNLSTPSAPRISFRRFVGPSRTIRRTIIPLSLEELGTRISRSWRPNWTSGDWS